MLHGKKILIESGGGVGDLIMFTPALRRLKELYPSCVITFLTIDKTVDVINRIPYIDHVISFKRGKLLGRYRVLPCLAQQDYMVFTEWQPQLLLCMWLLRLPNRFSVSKVGHLLTRTLHKSITNTVAKSADFAAKTNAALIGDALNIELDGDMDQCDISIPSEIEKKQVDDLLKSIGLNPSEDYIALSPFTSADGRDWPLIEAKKLVNQIQEKYNVPVVIIGNKNGSMNIEEISKYSLFQKTNIMQLIEVIRRATCLVSPDSGPVHIAGALKVPCVALFSRDIPSRWAPKHNCYPIYLNFECSPCEESVFKNCPNDLKCIRDITAEMVMGKMQEVFK